MGLHPAYAHLEKDYPVGDRSLLRRLARTLSALTHWAPVLGEVAFLPALAFPFVRLFKADLESCFEVSAAGDSPTTLVWAVHITLFCNQLTLGQQHVVNMAFCTYKCDGRHAALLGLAQPQDPSTP